MQLNKPLFTLFLMLTFSLPSFAEENDIKLLPPIQTEEQTLDNSIDEAIKNEPIQEVITPKVADIQEMTPNANEKVRNEVVSDTNNHLNGVIKKFLAAMAGVIISSIIIFILATLFNKFNKYKSGKPEEFFEEKEEASPTNDENEALKIFFEKTK